MAKRLTISTRITLDEVGNVTADVYLRLNNKLLEEKSYKFQFTNEGVSYLDIVKKLDVEALLQSQAESMSEFGC